MLIRDVFDCYRHPPTGLGAHLAHLTAKAPPATTIHAQDGGYDLLLYDVIGCGCCEPEDIVSALAVAGGAPVRVRINSPGGDAFSGFAIYNLLAAYSGEITVLIDGVAASAASYIAMAGSHIEMQPASFLMIHNGWTVAVGDRNRLATQISALQKIDDAQCTIFAARAGLPPEDVAAMLDAETWFAAQEAVDTGFADAIAANTTPQPVLPDDAGDSGDDTMDEPMMGKPKPMPKPMPMPKPQPMPMQQSFALEKRRRLLSARLITARAK